LSLYKACRFTFKKDKVKTLFLMAWHPMPPIVPIVFKSVFRIHAFQKRPLPDQMRSGVDEQLDEKSSLEDGEGRGPSFRVSSLRAA
jgi:hypothetical protein